MCSLTIFSINTTLISIYGLKMTIQVINFACVEKNFSKLSKYTLRSTDDTPRP